MVRNFMEMMRGQWQKDNFVCVGLDSEIGKIPAHLRRVEADNPIRHLQFHFNGKIINATGNLVCAYKLNIAFYEELGEDGWASLKRTVEFIRQRFPNVPVILDAKRGDIGNTNLGYVRAAFGYLDADAITVSPYLGQEALKPFLEMKDRGIVVLCRTSNPGAGEFQDLRVLQIDERNRTSKPLYQIVAKHVAEEWNANGNCAIVAGATCPEELGEIRKIVGDLPILIPGVGAQGADVEKTVAAGRDSRGQGMIINSSRGIIFASNKEDFDVVARQKTIELRDLINRYR